MTSSTTRAQSSAPSRHSSTHLSPLQTSGNTREAGNLDGSAELSAMTSASSERTIQFEDRVASRKPSTSHLPPQEKMEYAPCRHAYKDRTMVEKMAEIRWRAVLAVAAGFCQQALSWGFIMVYGSQFTYYEDNLLPSYSRVELSLPGAIAPALLLTFSMVHGRLCDAHYHRWINVIGSIFLIVGFFLLAFSSGAGGQGEGNYGIILIAYILQGIGQSSFFVTSSHIASSWYPDNPAIPIGITSCGVAIAGIIWPVMFQEGASAWGFRNAVGGMTGLVILLCIFVCIFGVPDPQQEKREVGKAASLRTWIDPAAIKSAEWLFATGSTCLIYLALLVIPQFMEDWATTQSLSANPDEAVLLLTIAMGCSLFGRLGGSFVARWMGFRVAHSMFNILQMIWIFAWWNLATTWAHAIIFAVGTGILIGAIITLPPGGMKEIVSSSPVSQRNASSSLDPEKAMPRTLSGQTSPLSNSTTNSSSADLVNAAADSHNLDRRASQVSAVATLASAMPVDDRMTRLGQWLGTSFLCAAPFVLTGNLATSKLVAQYGILSAGWWAGACYGGAGVCLLLSVLASRLRERSAV